MDDESATCQQHADRWPPSENCYCGGPEEIYAHRYGTGRACRAKVKQQPVRQKQAVMDTPTTAAGMRALDHLNPVDAVVAAWTAPGAHPGWHQQAINQVRRTMPILARHLDRLATEHPAERDPRWRP